MTASSAVQARRWILSILLVALCVLGALRAIDQRALPHIDRAFDRALVTFAIVRGINAVISVIQGTEFAIEPAGIGVILTPGEAFDPVNDMIERFSWIMLLASTSLAAQKIILGIGASLSLQIAVFLASAVLLLRIWRPASFSDNWRSIAVRLSIALLFLRFAVPVTAVLNQAVYDSFLEEQFQTSYSALEQTRNDVEALQSEERPGGTDEASSGLLGNLARWYDRTTQSLDVQARINEYKAEFARASEHIVQLIVVFLLQTIVFPLLLLWLGARLMGVIVLGHRH